MIMPLYSLALWIPIGIPGLTKLDISSFYWKYYIGRKGILLLPLLSQCSTLVLFSNISEYFDAEIPSNSMKKCHLGKPQRASHFHGCSSISKNCCNYRSVFSKSKQPKKLYLVLIHL